MSDFTICPTAFGRGEKKLHKEHIVQWWRWCEGRPSNRLHFNDHDDEDDDEEGDDDEYNDENEDDHDDDDDDEDDFDAYDATMMTVMRGPPIQHR